MYKNNLLRAREDVSTVLYNQGKPPMTQERLATTCGVSRQSIWSIESEDSMPSYPLALRIFTALRRFDPKLALLDLFPVPPLNQGVRSEKKQETQRQL